MDEAKRVFRSWRFWGILILLILPGLVSVIYGYPMDYEPNDPVGLAATDTEAYLDLVENQYEQMLDRARQASGTSIFSDPDSFANRNIQKTLRDFASFQNIQVQPVQARAFLLYFHNLAADLSLAVWMLTAVMVIFKDRRNGLWPIIHTLPRGRRQLALVRIGILAGTALQGVLVIDGARWLISNISFDSFRDWAQPIQAVPGFNEVTPVCSIAVFALAYSLVRTGMAFLLGLLLILLLILFPKIQLAAAGLAGLFALETVLFFTIGDNSRWLWLRGINLVNLVHPLPLLQNYINLSVFGTLITLRQLTLLVFLAAGMFLAAAAVLSLACRYPYRSERIRETRKRIGVPTRLAVRRFAVKPLWLWAVHQQIVHAYGWLLIPVVILYFCFVYSPPHLATSLENQHARLYFERWSGTVDMEKLRAIDAEAQALQKKLDLLLPMASGSNEPGQLQVQRVVLDSQIAGLKHVQDTIARQQALNPDTIRLVNPYPYRIFWDPRAVSGQREVGLIVMTACLLFTAGLFSFDQRGSTADLLHSLPEGRTPLVRSRLAGAYALCALFSLSCMTIVSIRQFRQIGFPALLSDRLSTLPWFSASSGRLPIWAGLVGFAALNILMQLGILTLSLWIASLKGSGQSQTILILLLLFILPAIFLLRSSSRAQWATLLAVASAWNTLTTQPWVLIVWLSLGLLSLGDMFRQYSRAK